MKVILTLLMACLCHLSTYAQTALNFDGVDDYTESNYYHQLDLGTGNFAMEAMVSNLDFSLSDTLTILSQQNTNSTQGICWSITSGGIHLQIESILYSMNHTFSGCTHLAIVRDNGNLLFYVNHILLGTQSIAGTVNATCTNCAIFMGKTIGDTNYFKGALDEVRIWNAARSGINIESYETSCLDSTAMTNSSLVAYWNFEENTGQFANNLSSVAHYARLGNSFYVDGNDPTWTTTSCVSSTCYPNGLANFSLSDNNPKEADLVALNKTSTNSTTLYWNINGDTTVSVDSLQYAFALGMNVIQLATTSANGLSARTVLLDVKRPKYPCGADEYTTWRQSNDPNYFRTQSLLYRASLHANNNSNPNSPEYHIPVIFHVIADNQATLNAFPASRIQAQLDTLNKYFSKDSTGISFCLAQNLLTTTGISASWFQYGSSVPGITYTLDTLDEFDFTNPTYRNEVMRKLPFDAKEYLNIYIVDTIIYPGISVLGVSSVGPNYGIFDGIGIDYDVFTGGAVAPMGKSLIHEVGHWLGLEHVFESDGICDTYEQFNPTSDSSIGNCSTPYSYGTSCPPNPPYFRGQNHLDYHNELCLSVFTGGQIDRMHYILDNGRPYVHSEYNLIATGVQELGGCVDKTNISAAFVASSESVCAGGSIELKGVEVLLDHWEWQISWDPNKNNGNPAPSMNGFCISASPLFGSSPDFPETTLSICEPGIWDVSLTIRDTTLVGGNTVITTDVDSMSIEVLDCSPNDQRNRVTLSFDSTDWQINGATIDNLGAIPNDTTIGHIVTGTGYILHQNSEGVVMRTNVFGSPLWRRAIRVPNADVELFDVVSNVNYLGTDRIALVGRVKRGNTSELLLVIVDRAGNLLFQETYQMNKNGVLQPNAVGLELIQLSNSFNNDLAIVGFVGEGDTINTDKRGFILGINPTTGIQWEHYFESGKFTTTDDYDIAENVTEIVGDFGNGLEAAIVISGHSNRTQGTNTGSGTFISCLTISGGVTTEEWRKNVEFPSGIGSSKPVAVAYDNGRLFFVSFNSLLHGSLIIEIDPNTGDFGNEVLIQDLYPVDLIIDGTNLILGGRNLSTNELAAAKIPIPAVTATNFNPSNITIRTYSDTKTQGDWGGVYNVSSYIKTPQSVVPSANGGYMFIGEYAPNLIVNNNFNDIGLVFNKIDDELITTCMAGDSYSSSLSNFSFGYINHADSTQLTASVGIDTINCDSLVATCYQLGCLTPGYTLNTFQFNKCSADTVMLTGNFSEIGDFSYQWSPSVYLSSDTVLVPTTTTPTTQLYTLIVTDNATGCEVAEANYLVTIPPDTINSLGFLNKCALDSVVLVNRNPNISNSSTFTYQWSPATGLSNPNILEPITFATILPAEYTLIAEEAGACTVHKVKYTVSRALASGGIVTQHRINCLSSDPAYSTNSNPPPNHHQLDLNLVLSNLGINDTTGIWSNPVPHQFITLTPPYFDTINNILNARYAEGLGTLYYTYGDTNSCQNRLILHFLPDASINGADTIDVCEEAVLTFNASGVDSTIEHRWVINGVSQVITTGGTSTIYTTLNIIPFGDSLSITGTFSYDTTYQYYEVSHTARRKNCQFYGTSFYTVDIYVSPADGTITLDTCTGTLTLPTNTLSDTIQWYDATTGLAITGETTHNYSPPTSGSYYATVTTPQCDFTSDTFNYTPLSPISSTATISSNYNGADISCFGAADGAATVIASNGLSPYTYLWSNGDTLATTTGLGAGNYQVTVIGACSDTSIASVTLGEPTAVVVIVDTVIHVSCAGLSDASIHLSTNGGTSPYTYLWSNTQTGNNATNLATGNYTVTVSDANSCTVSTTISVSEPNVLTTTLTNTNPISCVGQSDGEITANTTGGTAPYTYLWSNSASTNVITNLSTGTYIVTITDVNNCTYIDSITLTVPPLPIVTTNTTNVSCNGAADGQITTSITGITAPYTYLWSNAQTGANATGLIAGGYTLTLTDDNGCTVSTTANVTEPTILSATLDSTNVDCIAPNSGAIDNTPTGGTLPYSYLWSNGATTEDVNGLIAGNYCVTITDANNCTFVACTNIEPLAAPLSVLKLVDKDTIVPYDTICYSIVVTNHCQSARDIVVTDTLPDGLLPTYLGSYTYGNVTNVLIDTLNLAAGTSDTLPFKVRVLITDSCGNNTTMVNQANAFELGNPSSIVSALASIWIKDTFATSCTPLPDTVYFSDLINTGQLLSNALAQSTPQVINVAGVWILDVGLTYSFTNSSVLNMSPGAQIIVSTGATLNLNNATVRAACANCLWQRILVQNNGTIAVYATTFRDAQYAIQAEDGAILQDITESNFLNNFIGIYIAPNANYNNLILGKFRDNVFSAPSILPTYVGVPGTPTLDISGTVSTITPNGVGLAGIYGWDIPALNLNLSPAALSNTFQRMVAGIVLFNSNFSTNSCNFNTMTQTALYPTNLAYQGCGVHVQSPLLIDFKETKIEDCSFENCFIGISGISSGMRIYRNQMTNIEDMGVRSMRLFNTIVHVQNNTFSDMERLGVAAFDPRIPSDIWIDNNTIEMNTVPGEGACILINDNPTGDASSLVISNNNLKANQAENGIAVLNHENSNDPKFSGLIQGNRITMEGNSPERAGISSMNSRLQIECNTISGDGQTLGATNTYGIVAAGGALGGVSTYQCNTVTNTYTGVFFEGFNNTVTFRGNGFDRHDIGLLMDGGSIIGNQFDNQGYYGNTWTHSTNLDAVHQGIALIQNQSQFFINSTPSLDFRPHNYNGLTGWFTDNSNFPNFDCVEPFNYCGNSRSSARFNTTNNRNNSSITPRITGLDNALASNGLGNIPLVTKYNAKRALFRKLVNNPSLAINSQNPQIQNFVASHQNTCIGHFDNVATQCKQTFMMSALDSILLDSCKNICLTYLDSLHHLDSLLGINFNSTIATNRNGVANNLGRVMQQQQVFLDNIETQQQIVLTPICTNNNSFNTTVLHEVLEKEVNDIYLNTLAKGILEFNASELVALRQIADHCPQEGGAAVHQARGMLSMVEDVNLLNFDCVSSGGRSNGEENSNTNKDNSIVENEMEVWNLILYPNPTSSLITLESNLVLEKSTRIEIYNVLGQKVKAISVNEATQSIEIDISLFLDGIYTLRLKNKENIITKSFVVVK
ncbi:T9SS type A sorting domain-containing protein [Aureispira sp. CCB-E]|uniref:T9SS type A sorting domain-containing protein n=1 Tax=Aureispira sp. CCB-E TaxID=3051121 RepID=UPI00286938F1|nr:T9SS type A sorting domain-containing protein [Aureispira sp. CCB-E]WMX13758.1 T9SS type A sorting domain-containing protein [Aureispira sp. CCB-E]